MKRISILALFLSLGGCATTSTTESVNLPAKIIPKHMAQDCTYIEQFAINKTNMFNSVNSKVQEAQVEAAQRAVARNGDSMVIEETDVTANGHVVNLTISTYACDS